MKRIALAALLCALVAVPAAGAHLGGPKGFESTVTRFTPATRGITASMQGGDDRIVLHNNTGKVLVIKGYSGEPYLRFSPDAVYLNDRSPAVYLNSDRYANVQVPPTATAKAKPQWEKILPGHAFTWHDHRVHWMSPILPPAVQKDPNATAPRLQLDDPGHARRQATARSTARSTTCRRRRPAGRAGGCSPCCSRSRSSAAPPRSSSTAASRAAKAAA